MYLIQIVSSYNNTKMLRIICNKKIHEHTNILFKNINTLKLCDLVEKKH